MPTLHDRIDALASDFAHQLLAALRGASLDEIISETSANHVRRGPGRPAGSRNKTQVRRGPGRPRAQVAGGGGEIPVPFIVKPGRRKGRRLARRSPADIAKMVERIVSVVKGSKKGINAEGIRAALKVDRSELPRPIAMALKSKTIRKTGQKRATTYFSGGSQSTSSPKAAKKTTPRAKKARKAKKQVVAHARRTPAKNIAKTKPSARGANGAAQAVSTAALVS